MAFDRQFLDELIARNDIVDVVSNYVSLQPRGGSLWGCCPFHSEKTPSFSVSPDKQIYHCFGCGKGGNAVTFLMEHENMTYPEALKAVAKRYGIEVREKEMTPEEVARNDNRESMFVVNSWAAEYFSNYLLHETEGMSVGMTYFRQKRGFSDATIKKFGLGFCPARGDRMSWAALAAGYKEEFLVSTGLSIKRDDGSLFDRFRERVMFPVHNISGRVVAFGGRTLRTDKSVAKYQNSPESEIYSKKRELYGLFFAKKAIQQYDFAIMVEGYTDVISMHQAGVENVVASLEGGVDALAFSTGMAAITMLMEIFKPGDHIITDADLYGGSIRLFDHVNEKNGLTFSHIDCTKEDIEAYIQENTKAVFIETLGNPNSNIIDIELSLIHI